MRSCRWLVSRGLSVALGLTLVGCSDDSAGPTSFGGSQTDSQTTAPASSSSTGVPTTSGSSTDATAGSDSLATDSNGTTAVPTTSTTGEPVTTTLDTSTGDGTTGDGTSTGDGTTGAGCLENVPDPACSGDADLIFVSTPPTGGSDLNGGKSKGDPVATLAHAMELALQCPDICDVVVSAGTYQKTITLASGVSIYGGYVPKSFVYDLAANVTIIDGTEDRAVIAEGLTLSTILSGFTIKGKSFAGEGKSSYAVWVKNVADDLLQIDRCTIQAGAGGLGGGRTGSDRQRTQAGRHRGGGGLDRALDQQRRREHGDRVERPARAQPLDPGLQTLVEQSLAARLVERLCSVLHAQRALSGDRAHDQISRIGVQLVHIGRG